MTGGIGTTFFMAPEVVTGAQQELAAHPFACDVYSYAILAWCILSGERPYATNAACDGLSPHQVTHKVVHEGMRPEIPTPCEGGDCGVDGGGGGGGGDGSGGDSSGENGNAQEECRYWSARTHSLLERCWCASAGKRPVFASVLQDMQGMRDDFNFDFGADAPGIDVQ
jgi:serine/threonine protein kinase